jgi:hypothetical protein
MLRDKIEVYENTSNDIKVPIKTTFEFLQSEFGKSHELNDSLLTRLKFVARQIHINSSTNKTRVAGPNGDVIIPQSPEEDFLVLWVPIMRKLKVSPLNRDRLTVVAREAYLHMKEIKGSHSFEHVAQVTKTVANNLSGVTYPATKVAAALLHECDDHKLFKKKAGSNDKSNAWKIASSVFFQEDVEDIINMVKWVGVTENGNNIPREADPKYGGDRFFLLPRAADRLEAIGIKGITRVFQYSCEVDRPYFDKNTPRPRTEKELMSLCTPERFNAYLKSKKSSTAMDHFVDKLLHLGGPVADLFPELAGEANQRHREMVDFYLEFSAKPCNAIYRALKYIVAESNEMREQICGRCPPV